VLHNTTKFVFIVFANSLIKTFTTLMTRQVGKEVHHKGYDLVLVERAISTIHANALLSVASHQKSMMDVPDFSSSFSFELQEGPHLLFVIQDELSRVSIKRILVFLSNRHRRHCQRKFTGSSSIFVN